MNALLINKFDTLNYAAEEAMNTLCTNLTFAGSGTTRILLTSCHAQEGKSFISMNLMRTFAVMGKRVVHVDIDLRRSAIMSRFDLQMPLDGKGLAHYLTKQCEAEDVVYKTNIPNAYMVPVGRDVRNSVQLLNSDRFPALMEHLSREFDCIVVDAPPIGVVIDAAIIAKHCDGILFVVSDNEVRRRELYEAKQQIEKTGCPILGAVLNKAQFNTASSKRHYYKAYYSYYNGYYGKSSSTARLRKERRPKHK